MEKKMLFWEKLEITQKLLISWKINMSLTEVPNFSPTGGCRGPGRGQHRPAGLFLW